MTWPVEPLMQFVQGFFSSPRCSRAEVLCICFRMSDRRAIGTMSCSRQCPSASSKLRYNVPSTSLNCSHCWQSARCAGGLKPRTWARSGFDRPSIRILQLHCTRPCIVILFNLYCMSLCTSTMNWIPALVAIHSGHGISIPVSLPFTMNYFVLILAASWSIVPAGLLVVWNCVTKPKIHDLFSIQTADPASMDETSK